jgi:hypothetical protein
VSIDENCPHPECPQAARKQKSGKIRSATFAARTHSRKSAFESTRNGIRFKSYAGAASQKNRRKWKGDHSAAGRNQTDGGSPLY